MAEFRITNSGPEPIFYTGYGDDPQVIAEAEYQDTNGKWSRSPVRLCGNGLHDERLGPGKSAVAVVALADRCNAMRLIVQMHYESYRDIEFRGAFVPVAGLIPPAPVVEIPKSSRAREHALLAAAHIGYDQKVRALLDTGVDANTRPGRPDGRTPIPYPGGGWASVECNWTPLHAAASRGNASMVKMLIASGADLEADDGCGGTPIIYAVQNTSTDAATALIDAGANVNAILRLPDIPMGSEGLRETPLIEAAKARNLSLVELLLDHGADPSARDGWGRTAIDYRRADRDADRSDQLERILRKAGAAGGVGKTD